MNPLPHVSVGLPVHNGERFLPETLPALLNQTYDDFELIISDNASTDRTAEICQDMAATDRRIRYYREPVNRGGAWNYNRVFALARGPLFRWHADDDLCESEYLATCVTALEADSRFILAYTAAKVIDGQGQRVVMPQVTLPFGSLDVVDRFRGALNPICFTDSSIFGIVRRDVLARTRLVGNYLAADRCLTGELLLQGPFLKCAPELFSRRRHDRNVDNTDVGWYDPARRMAVVFGAWKVLLENIKSVTRSPHDLNTKRQLMCELGRWSWHQRTTLRRCLTEGIEQLAHKYSPLAKRELL
jgi:glycosyltransferase involved in cell wall biosynthesis